MFFVMTKSFNFELTWSKIPIKFQSDTKFSFTNN